MSASEGHVVSQPLESVGSRADAETAEQAFERLLQDRYAGLVRTIELIVKERGAAEDIVQETFARAYLNWPKLWPSGNPAGWTYRVAVNLARSWWRRAAREARALTRVGPRAQAATDVGSAVDVRRAVAALPLRQRTAVALFYTLDLPVAEIARVMGCKPGTVRALLHGARESVRKRVE